MFLHEKYFWNILLLPHTHTHTSSRLVVDVRAYKVLKPAVLCLLRAGWFRGVTPRDVALSSVSLYCGDRRGVTAGCGVSLLSWGVWQFQTKGQKGVSATVKQSGGNWDLHLPSAHHPLPSAHLYRPGEEELNGNFVNLRMLQRVWQKFGFLVSGNRRMMNRQYADTAGLSLTHTYGAFMRIFWRSKFSRLINIDCTVYGL